MNNPAAAAARAAQANANEAARARVQTQQSMAVFANAQAAIRGVVAAQEAARRAAQVGASAVPNGLVAGGLVLTGIGNIDGRDDALAPVQTGPANAPTVTVTQVNTQAILTWRSFNVGRETTLNFDQSTFGGTRAREFSVLNRVDDINPSLILGRINAPGQVFVINRSGIIFGGASQINVGTLVASTLDVGSWGQTLEQRNAAFRGGLARFLATGENDRETAANAGLTPYRPNLTATDLPTLGASIRTARDAGDADRFAVNVRPGAQISLAEQGFALLAGAAGVRNQGTIAAPSGQVHLAAAAGLRFQPTVQLAARAAVTAPLFNGVTSFQAPDIGYYLETFRRSPALDTSLDDVRASSVNDGLISAPRGSITLAGASVANFGALAATTAANRAGSVFLLARDVGGVAENVALSVGAIPQNSFRFGEVRLGSASVIDIAGETGADQVVFDTATSPFQQSRIGINGSAVWFGGRGVDVTTGAASLGAIVRAPAARLRIAADITPAFTFIEGTAQETSRLQIVQLGSGSVIDLAGVKGVEIPVARNLIELPVRNNILSDQPVQRNGVLVDLANDRIPVVVDIRLGTSLFEFLPTANAIPRSVAERQLGGGSVEFAAERVVTQPDSRIDVSGGWINWQGGLRAPETQLIGSDGRIYRLSNAPADLTYIGRPGLFTRAQPRWNIVENFVSPLFAARAQFEQGYIEGADAGSISITARPTLAGVLDGSVFVGQRQAQNANASRPNDGNPQSTTDLPNGGTLRLLARLRRIDTGDVLPRTSGGLNIGAPVNPTFVTNFGDGLTAALPEFDPLQPGALTTPTLGVAVGGTGAGQSATGDSRIAGTLPAALFDTRIPTTTITDNGFRTLEIEAEGRLLVPTGSAVSLRPGGLLSIEAWNARIDGTLRIPAGQIAITANSGDIVVSATADLDLARRFTAQPQPIGLTGPGTVATTVGGVPTEGSIILGGGALLTTRGLFVNDFLAEQVGDPRQGSAFLNGGTISLATRYSGYADVAPSRTSPGLQNSPAAPAGAVLPTAGPTRPVAVFGRDILLFENATLDVSGGGRVGTVPGRPTLTAANAGTLSLNTYAGLAASPTGTTVTAANGIVAPPVVSGGSVYPGQRNFAREDRYSGLIDNGASIIGFGLARVAGGAGNGRGGLINLSAPSYVLGRALTDAEAAAGVSVIDLARFASAGFAGYAVSAVTLGYAFPGLPTGVLRVAPGSTVAPRPSSLLLFDSFATAPSGVDPATFAVPTLLPETDRSPTRLTLAAGGLLDFGRRATADAPPTVLLADPGAIGAGAPSITLSTGRPLYFDGSIVAPGGDIRITRGEIVFPTVNNEELRIPELFPRSGDALWIAAGSTLSTAGTATTLTDRFGVTRGVVRAGGNIAISDGVGYVVLEASRGTTPASSIDVSGTAATISSIRTGLALSRTITSQTIASSAGTLAVLGRNGAFVEAALRALPGAPGAAGGTLSVQQFAGNGPVRFFGAPSSVPVGQVLPPPIDAAFANSILVGDAARTALPATALAVVGDPTAPIDPTLQLTAAGDSVGRYTGFAFLDPDRLTGSGIERINLLGRTIVEGSPQLAVGRMLQLGDVVLRPSAVPGAPPPNARLAAPYIVLNGTDATLLPPGTVSALGGSLTLAASDQLDITRASIRGAEQVVLESAGDIRLVGPAGTAAAPLVVLTSQGNLTLRAQQVYVDTAVRANIAVIRQPGDAAANPTRPATIPTLTIAAFGGPAPVTPLAADGQLTLTADRIVQAGVLRAPQGRLILEASDRITFAPGSLTSIAAGGRTVPFGQSQSAQNPLGIELVTALDPNTGLATPLTAPPSKSITLTAARVDLQGGANIDLSGDGELVAYRFVQGPGGNRDVLARATVNDTRTGYLPGTFQFGADGRDVFAILPGAQPYGAPRSPYILDSGDSLGRGDVTAIGLGGITNLSLPSVGDQIEIGGGIDGLPAGRYTLLPARYAVLGGYQVVIPPAAGGLLAATPLDTALRGRDGRYVVGANRVVSGTGLIESQQRLVTIRPPEVWGALSTIIVDSYSGYFAQRAALNETPAPRLPIDAGRLTVSATKQLVLDATGRFDRGPGGRGAQLDISADLLAIAPRERIVATADGANAIIGPDGAVRADLAGYLPVAGEALTGLGAESVLLGGARNDLVRINNIARPDVQGLFVSASNVRLTEGASITAPELLLVAGRPAGVAQAGRTTGIVLEAGSALVAAGAPLVGSFRTVALGDRFVRGLADEAAGRLPNVDPNDLPGLAGAALIRVSTAAQIEVLRPSPISASTVLADVAWGGDVAVRGPTGTIDLVGAAAVADRVEFGVGDLKVTAPRIVLGTAAMPIAGAFTLSQEALARLAVGTLTLAGGGASPIDVFGDVRLATADRITLDAPGLRNAAGARLALESGVVALRNRGGFAAVPVSGGAGTLAINAPLEARFGEGPFALAGIGNVTVNAGAVVATGVGRLDFAAPLTVDTGRVTAAAGASVDIATTGSVVLAGAPVAGAPAIGGRVAITGNSVVLATRAEARGGTVELTAAAGDIVLQPGSTVDVRGLAVQFFDVTRYLGGGGATLTAAGGITVGGVLDVSSADLGAVEAEAGRLRFVAGGAASFVEGGGVVGVAAPGARSGSFTFSSSGAVDLPALNTALDAGNFREGRVVSAGAGDLVVEAGRVMAARQVSLAANAGAVVVGGTIDAGGPKGGSIELWARDRVRIEQGGAVSALNAEAGQRGGTISIGTTVGPLELFGTIAAFVPGSSDPLYGGRVRLRLPEVVAAARTSTIDPARIASRAGTEVAPFRIVQRPDGIISPAEIIGNSNELAATTAGAFATGLRITPEIVVTNPGGPLTLPQAQPIELQALRTTAGEGGVLTLRAGGDLTILSNISDGFTTSLSTGRLLAESSGWSLRLVAGAADGANPSAVGPGPGSVLIAPVWQIASPYTPQTASGNSNVIINPPPPTNPVLVRTGTGSIEVAAATDLLLRDPDAAIYTAGRRITDPTRWVNPATGQVEFFYLPLDPTYIANGASTTYVAGLDPLRYTPNQPVRSSQTIASYPVEGGDLSLNAVRDVRALVLMPTGLNGSALLNVGQTTSNWLWRQGLVTESGQFLFRPGIATNQYLFGQTYAGQYPIVNPTAYSSQTTWFVNFGAFAQNFALLGGGDARIAAGRDWQGSISIPTTARTFGGLASSYDYSYRASASATAALARTTGSVPGGGTPAQLVVTGGGDLSLDVGRDVLPGSQFFLGRGDGRLTVGGNVAGQRNAVSRKLSFAPEFGLGDSRFVVDVRGAADFTVTDPFQLAASRFQQLSDYWGYGGFTAVPRFSSQSLRSAVSVTANGAITIAEAVASNNAGLAVTMAEARLAVPSAIAGAPRSIGSTGVFRGALPANPPELGGNALPSTNKDLLTSIFNDRLAPAFGVDPGPILPPRFLVTALTGDLTSVVRRLEPASFTTLRAPIVQSRTFALLAGGDIVGLTVVAEDRPLADASVPLRPQQTQSASLTAAGFLLPTPRRPLPSVDGVAYLEALNAATPSSTPLRAADPGRDLIYALGDIIRPLVGTLGIFSSTQGSTITLTQAVVPFAKQLVLRSGQDISDAAIFLQHSGEADVSQVRAGRDINALLLSTDLNYGNVFEIGGPGRLQIIAGRNIAPVRQPVVTPVFTGSGATRTFTGNYTPGPLNGIRSIGNTRNALLPEGGASIDVLFGVGPNTGFDPDALLDRLLDPADAARAYGTTRVELGSVFRQNGTTRFLPGVPQANGAYLGFIQPNAPAPTDPATLATIRALPEPERLALAIDLYFREIGAAGREAAGTTGPRQGSYVRGNAAIADLFPNRAEYAGNFNIQGNFIRTEQRGDINVLGPGGDFLIGATAGLREPPGFADRFGVLTLGYGNINLFTDGDIAAGQSRILTLDGGDIVAWSTTRDINAGLGARTARFVPPFRVSYLPNLTQVPNRAGQITGSGISTFVPFTAPDQVESLRRTPASDVELYAQTEERRRRALPLSLAQLQAVASASSGPQVVLIAPVGTVDFGDAGVRVAGDLVVAARTVANASNATVAGTSVGVPVVAVSNVAGALAAASTAGATNAVAEAANKSARDQAQQPQRRPRTLTARVVGWGDTEEEALRAR